ncbi:unnamed protein product [Microthlaspi erraticum]|uniref:Uncharacterized protein n=1 Tax=Microthlaspi erraticum TaxID=1685480 RepID=A0A6D2I246_9BRAS|nr:unnamed protein product [Microthlaspi erraticum]
MQLFQRSLRGRSFAMAMEEESFSKVIQIGDLSSDYMSFSFVSEQDRLSKNMDLLSFHCLNRSVYLSSSYPYNQRAIPLDFVRRFSDIELLGKMKITAKWGTTWEVEICKAQDSSTWTSLDGTGLSGTTVWEAVI